MLEYKYVISKKVYELIGEFFAMSIIKVAVTSGDPAGIGPEVTIKALISQRLYENCIPIVIGDKEVIDKAVDSFKIDLKPIVIKEEDIASVKKSGNSIYIVNLNVVSNISKLEIGKKSKLGGEASYRYIVKAVELAKKGLVKCMVTAPINKESIKLYGIQESGHTEILGRLTGSNNSVTMFSVDKMKIFFHTRHISLKRMIETLNIENLYESIMLSNYSLLSIGYNNPHLALAALNPHASDGGLFGTEENDILVPACKRAMKSGVNVEGPVPADSVFHLCLEGKYDAVISLYHDQGHIAAKTYDFYRTVSVTLGLPFIRTSVDHGTAFDIAWKGIANPISMVEAINTCCQLSANYKNLIN